MSMASTPQHLVTAQNLREQQKLWDAGKGGVAKAAPRPYDARADRAHTRQVIAELDAAKHAKLEKQWAKDPQFRTTEYLLECGRDEFTSALDIKFKFRVENFGYAIKHGTQSAILGNLEAVKFLETTYGRGVSGVVAPNPGWAQYWHIVGEKITEIQARPAIIRDHIEQGSRSPHNIEAAWIYLMSKKFSPTHRFSKVQREHYQNLHDRAMQNIQLLNEISSSKCVIL